MTATQRYPLFGAPCEHCGAFIRWIHDRPVTHNCHDHETKEAAPWMRK